MNTLHADSTELESRNLTVRVERVGRQYICRGLAKVKRDEHATGFDGIVLSYFQLNRATATDDGDASAVFDEVLRVLDSIRTTDEVQSAYASRSSYLEHSPISTVEELDEEIAFCRDFLEGLERNPDDVWLGYGPHTVNLPPSFDRDARRRVVERRIMLTEQVRGRSGQIFEPLSLELQMFRWNEFALILNPLQLFVQLGLEVKRRSRHRYTFPVCFTGGGMSPYIGPADEVARGGYHFTPFRPARWAPGNALRLVDEMAELANT